MTASEWAEFRVGLIADTIQDIFTGKRLPKEYPDEHALAKGAVDFFYKNGGVQVLAEAESKWALTKEYVLNHMHKIQKELGRRETPFIYYRKQGEIKGIWKFPTKEELVETRARAEKDISTRAEH